MTYYEKEFRTFLIGILNDYRKMIESSLASSQDPNYHHLSNYRKNQIDEAIRTIKPSSFDALRASKIEKLQEEKFLKQKAEENKAEYEKQAEALKQEYEVKLQKFKDNYLNEQKKNQKELQDMITVELLTKVLSDVLKENSSQAVEKKNKASQTPAEKPTDENVSSEDDTFHEFDPADNVV